MDLKHGVEVVHLLLLLGRHLGLQESHCVHDYRHTLQVKLHLTRANLVQRHATLLCNFTVNVLKEPTLEFLPESLDLELGASSGLVL